MATISLGKVAFKWRGDYDPTTTYDGQDVVALGGTSYVCKADSTTGVTPGTNPDKWDVFAQGVEGITQNPGEILYYDGTQLQALPTGAPNQTLKVGSLGLPEWSAPSIRSGMRVSYIQDNRQHMTYRRGFAVMEDGTCRAWGRGENWMLGQGNQTNDRSYPIRVAFPHYAAPIDRMWMQYDIMSVAIDTDGKLWVWGQNDYGEVGSGNTQDTYVPYCPSDNPSNSIYGKTVVDYAPMSSAENYLSVMVLCSDGTVHTCGYNGYGQLGQGDTNTRYNFVQVPLLSDIVQIARGRERYTSCYALKSTGEMYSWGYAGESQLGHGNTTQMNIPMQIMYFATNSINIVNMGAAGGNAWAISDTGDLYTWGYNGYGNLGHNGTTTTATPGLALTNVVDVVMHGVNGDYNSTYALRGDGSVWSVGDNTYGCLGVAADTTDRSIFQECLKVDGTGFTNAVQIVKGGSGSYNYAAILDADGVAWTVGYSGNGQLGIGTFSATNYWFQPVLIHRRQVVAMHSIGTGSEGGLQFLLDDGQLYQSGYGGESQLPEDDDENISVPMPILF